MIESALESTAYDDYDRLIQLCDALAGSSCVMDLEDRMNDVKRRYGTYPQPKWDMNMALKEYFEEKTGKDLYLLLEKDRFFLQG